MSEDKAVQALRRIAEFRPEDHGETSDEWGEAWAFGKCREIAREALAEIDSKPATEQAEPTWAGAAPFVQHVQVAAGSAGSEGHWPDEFLAWYKPSDWLGEHRAAAVFLGAKFAAQQATQPARVPLSETQIDHLLPEIVSGGSFTVITYGRAVARAIERAHGIGIVGDGSG